MDCSGRTVLECIACASNRCNAIDTLRRNHVHNKLMEVPDPTHSLDVAHSTENRSDLSDNAPYVSRAKDTVVYNIIVWGSHVQYETYNELCRSMHSHVRIKCESVVLDVST